jgi:DNA-binding GntR family transcriptional regulator
LKDVKQSLAERAYDQLEELIVTVQFKPGATLVETALMEQTGFGRTPVREALLRLADVGLVTIVPRRGTVVTRTDPEDQLQLLEVRRVLERLIAMRAAVKTGPAEKAVFAAMALEMREAAATDDYLLFLRVDHRFNQGVAVSAGNRHLLRSITPIHALARRFWYSHYRPYDLATAAKLHAVIMEAIAAGDGDAAGAASDALLDYVEAFTRAVSSGVAQEQALE